MPTPRTVTETLNYLNIYIMHSEKDQTNERNY